MIASLLAALLSSAPKHIVHAPRWLDTILAGYSLAFDQRHNVVAIYDPSTKFFLVRDVVCDGADISLLLTRDRSEIAAVGYEVPNFTPASGNNGSQAIVVKPLPSLSTGKGVQIGDSPEAVQGRIGVPVKVDHTGSRQQFVEYIYTWRNGKGMGSTLFDERYTFKAGRLIEISFLSDSGPD